MPDDIDHRLARAKERLRGRHKLEAMLQQVQAVLQDERHKCAGLVQARAAEEADVEKLEGYGLRGLFYSILGDKEARLETERQEYLAARLKHEDCRRAIEDARSEVERLQSELAGYEQAEAEYQRLVEEKELLLKQSGDLRARDLLGLAEQLADLQSDRKELQEAVQAGDSAVRALEQVRSELRSAENWGTWDMFGGGLLATMTKHSQIDAARRQAQVAQQQLRRFEEELADANHRLHVSLEDIGGIAVFADYFIDGLIADWVVQSKIHKALDACSSAIAKVSAALSECRRRLSATEKALEQVSAQRCDLIERT